MIRTERLAGSTDLVRTYSDAGLMIIQDGTGDMYAEAVDPDYMGRTYTESDVPIPVPVDDEEIDDAEAMELLFGGEQ